MKNSAQHQQFDVIVVYSSQTAKSAGDSAYVGRAPFARNDDYFSYNRSYAYFLQYCKTQGLRAAFATTDDIIGTGLFSAVWVWDALQWKRVLQPVHTRLIFDKFFRGERKNIAQHRLLGGASGALGVKSAVHFFHDKRMRALFNDKLETYNVFPKYAVPTVAIDLRSEKKILAAQKKLQRMMQRHPHAEDFAETCVVKDRFGAGGVNVFKTARLSRLLAIGKQNPEVSFVLQPFITATGFRFGKHVGAIDLRLIVCNGAIAQCFIRVPKKGEFRANASQGGRVSYLKISQIPADVKRMAKAIDKQLPVRRGFYALDFMKSSTGHLYFIEGNITPGLNWFTAEDERRAKQFIRLIVKNLKTLA